MSKVLFLVLFSILFFASASEQSFAKTHYTYADFVHLTPEQQDEHIQRMMEVFVELEEKYKKDVRSGKTNSEYFRRYSQLLFKMSSLFISDAHANTGNFSNVANSVKSYIDRARPNSVCLFGGWPSQMRGGLCTHPMNAASNGYLRGGCRSNEVSCNPLIFGYRRKDDGSVFCVDTDDKAVNSSLRCMQRALSPLAGDDTRDVRLEELKKRIQDNPSIVDGIYTLAYKTCVCDTPPPQMVGLYQEAIRPHRTCFGLMRSMAETTALCATEILSSVNRDMLTSFVRENPVESLGRSAEVYDSAFRDFRNDRISAAQKASLCGTNGGPVTEDRPQNCIATCTPGATPADEPNCSGFKIGADDVTRLPGTNISYNTDRTTATIRYQPTTPPGSPPIDLVCQIPPPQPTPDVQTDRDCTATCTAAVAPAEPTCTFSRANAPVTPDANSTPVSSEVTEGDTTTKIYRFSYRPAPAAGQPATPPPAARNIECRVTPPPAPVSGGKLNITVSQKTVTVNSITFSAVVKKPGSADEIDDATIEWSEKPSSDDDEEDDDDSTTGNGSVLDEDTAPITVGTTTDSDTDVLETGPEASFEKETEDYEVCAVAKKTGFDDSDPACKKVPKLSGANVVPGAGGPGQQQPTGPGGVQRRMGIR